MELFKNPENLNKDFSIVIISIICGVKSEDLNYGICKLIKSIKEQHHMIRFKTVPGDKIRRRVVALLKYSDALAYSYLSASYCDIIERLNIILSNKIYKNKDGYVHVLSFDVNIDEKDGSWIIDLKKKNYWELNTYFDILPIDLIEIFIINLCNYDKEGPVSLIDTLDKEGIRYVYIFSQVYPKLFNYIKEKDPKKISKPNNESWKSLLTFSRKVHIDDSWITKNKGHWIKLHIYDDMDNKDIINYLSSIGIIVSKIYS